LTNETRNILHCILAPTDWKLACSVFAQELDRSCSSASGKNGLRSEFLDVEHLRSLPVSAFAPWTAAPLPPPSYSRRCSHQTAIESPPLLAPNCNWECKICKNKEQSRDAQNLTSRQARQKERPAGVVQNVNEQHPIP
jgi:hypothetical protein